MKYNENHKRIAILGIVATLVIAIASISSLAHYTAAQSRKDIKLKIKEIQLDMFMIEKQQDEAFQLIEEIKKERLEEAAIAKYETLNTVGESANKEDADYRWDALVSTTFRLETGNGESNLWLHDNNPGGIKCFDGVNEYCSYESKEEGFQALESLLESYVDEFGYDFKKIREKYNPGDDQDFNKFITIYEEEYSSYQLMD